MVDFGAPYAVDGSVIPGSGLRRQLQRETGEGSGVVRATDLRITQMNVPGAGVRISPGDDLIQCRAPGRDRETYGIPLLTAQNYLGDSGAGIDGTGSSGGRRDMIIHEVLDPELPRHYTPRDQWPAGALSKLSVVPGVPATAKTVDDVPALNDVTCYALAAIKWPASTGTITNAMIEDLREVQSPRRSEALFARPRVAADDGRQMFLTAPMTNGGEFFPGGAGIANEFKVQVPAWATRMVIDAAWMAIMYDANVSPYGRFWVEFGTEYRAKGWANKHDFEFSTQDFWFNAPLTPDQKSDNWLLADEVPVPAKLRGKEVTFVFKAGLENATASKVWMTSLGGLKCRLTFAEQAIGADLI